MSILLFVIGAITLIFGALAIGFGIPVNEFSFGNTLIMAGTTAAVGGLVVIGLGAVVSHLQRLAEVMAMRAPMRPSRAPDGPEVGRAAASRVPAPPTVKPELASDEAPPLEPLTVPLHAAMPAGEAPVQVEAPTLPNPDVPPKEEVAEGVPTAPPLFAAMPPSSAEPNGPAAPARKSRFSFNGSEPSEPASEPLPAWLTATRTPEPLPPEPPAEAHFEAVWPAAKGRTVDQPAVEEDQPAAAAPTAPEAIPESEALEVTSERRAVAILKSGVVDGMAYTLYVDGSIEAELPQGTLRFASINELREHLENTL